MFYEMKKVWQSVILLSACWVHAAAATAFHTELYTEQGYLTETDSLISSLRVRESFPGRFNISPFLQLGNELDAYRGYLYLGPGISWRLLNFTTLLEWRERAFYQTSQSQQGRDLRASLIYNKQWLSHLSKKYGFIGEVYTEGVLSSADESNTIFSGWVRVGLRQSFSNPVVFDLFLEPFASTDILGRAYNRRVEVRPTLRAQYFFEKISIGLSGAYFIPLGRSGGVRVLAVMGGEI